RMRGDFVPSVAEFPDQFPFARIGEIVCNQEKRRGRPRLVENLERIANAALVERIHFVPVRMSVDGKNGRCSVEIDMDGGMQGQGLPVGRSRAHQQIQRVTWWPMGPAMESGRRRQTAFARLIPSK